MDKSVKPGDDFFSYVNGTWAKNTPIPSDRSSYGGFAVLRDLSEARMRQLVEGYKVGNPARDGTRPRSRALRGFLDEAAIEKLDAKPIQPKLAAIRAIRNKDEMARSMGEALGGGFGGTFFGSFVNDDSKNPDYYVLYMGQSGLGLSDRELYLQEKFAPQKTRYQQYVAQTARHGRLAECRRAAGQGGRAGNQIADAHWTRAESRNRDKTYNPTTLAELQKSAPASTGRRSSMPAGSARPRRSSSHRTRLSRSSPRSSLRPTSKRSRPGRPSTPWMTPRRSSPSASSTPISSSGRNF
jgi:putative endopeptidase